MRSAKVLRSARRGHFCSTKARATALLIASRLTPIVTTAILAPELVEVSIHTGYCRLCSDVSR